MFVIARSFRTAWLIVAFAAASISSGFAAAPSALLGTWTFDAGSSTDLSPWRSSQLTIAQSGTTLTITRALAGGRRAHTETTTLDLAQPRNVVPQTWWVDNRHLGAYAPTDGQQTITARWLDDGQVLRLEIDFTLETQQGPRAVNTIRQFQVSPDGQLLTMIDLRSTRPLPVTHVYTRVTE